MKKYLKRIGLDYFILSLFLVIVFAWLKPEYGAGTGFWSLSTFAHYGVAVIFFFYGLKLDWKQILLGLKNYRLHFIVFFSTFVLFPLLLIGPTRYFVGLYENNETQRWLWIGIFFLGTLPSTVSSSVVMVNIAKGNLPAAIFDASISSLLGVFITPLWMQLFISANNQGGTFGGVLLSLICQVVIPVVLGILLHPIAGKVVSKHSVALRRFDQSIILLIVYTSFCHSFYEKMFSEMTFRALFMLILGMIFLFFLVYEIINWTCLRLKFSREDRITTLFCGSKKSLVHGTVMSQVLLPKPELAGVMILPTMIFHAMQLIIVSIFAQKFAQDSEWEKK